MPNILRITSEGSIEIDNQQIVIDQDSFQLLNTNFFLTELNESRQESSQSIIPTQPTYSWEKIKDIISL